MKKLLAPVTAACLCAAFSLPAQTEEGDAVAAVKELITKSYVHGAFNALDPEAMAAGFHPDFAIFSPDGENIKKYPIADWVKRTGERKSAPDFDASANVWEHEFVSVDVTDHAASVKIELSKDGKLVYTDYLSLLKFESGWRVVAKVYASHRD